MADAIQVLSAPEAAPEPSAPAWPLWKRVLFRLAFVYFLVYSLPEPGRVDIITSIPGGSWVMKPYTNAWHAIVPWVAIHVFHVTGQPATYFPTGSGDTTLSYVHNLLYLVLAVVAAAVWSALDRKRPHYRTLDAWFRVWIRYALAFTMFGYGFVKVFPLQFRPPSFPKLIEPWGDFSPMGALWSFMGASVPYIIFSGVAEVTGGVLLFLRRTTTLGSMVCFAVLLNVAALNYCYDVPVKLYSTNLVLMSLFLMAPQMNRLLRFLVLNRATEPADLSEPPFSRRGLRIAATVFQVLLVGYALIGSVVEGWQGYRQTYITPPRPPLYGLYEIETFNRNGQDVPPLVTDTTRWRRIMFPAPRAATVSLMNDTLQPYGAEYDAGKNSVTLTKKDDKYPFTYSWSDADHLTLKGTVGTDALVLQLRKVDTTKKLLLNRGFHWINEMPFNK